MNKLKLLTLIFIQMSVQLHGQSSKELYNTISEMDSLYFSAQNNCDLEKYKSFLADDFEFYHDKAGLTSSRDNEMADMKIFCGEQRKRQPLRRELKKGTLKVYPLNNYGALETCEHSFYLQIAGGTEKLVGQAKFTCIWKLENAIWRIARIISYDHQPLGKTKLSDKILESYSGNYKADDRIINIARENNILRVTDIQKGKSVWNAELLPEADNIFYLNYENVQYKFVKDRANILKIIIYENGKKLEEANKMD